MSTADACSAKHSPANFPGAYRADPHSHLWHVQVAADSDAREGLCVLSSFWHQGKQTEDMELGGFRHKVKVSAVKKARAQGIWQRDF